MSFCNFAEAKTSKSDIAKGKQLYTTGIQSLGSGDYKGAAQNFMDAEVKDKDNPLYELLAGDTLRYLKQYPSSIRYYTETLEHLKKADKKVRSKIEAKAYIGLAESYLGNKEETNALKYADKAIKEFKDDYRGHYVKGNIYENNKTTQEQAISEYQEALKIDKTQYNPYVKLIKMYNKQGNIDKVIDVYKQAVDYRPVDENMKMSLAQVYISETKKEGAVKNYYPEAIEVLKSLTNINKKNYYAHYYLSTVYLLQGNKEKCYEEMSIVNNLNPNLGNKLSREVAAYVKKHGTELAPKTDIKIDQAGGITVSVNGKEKTNTEGLNQEVITLDDDKKESDSVDNKDEKNEKEDTFISKQVSTLESKMKKDFGA